MNPDGFIRALLLTLSSLASCGVSNAASGPVGKTPPPAVQKVPVRKVEVCKDPVLITVNPAKGSPSDKILITGKYLPTDMSLLEVWFVLTQEVQAKKLKVTTNKDVVSYEVQVPATDELHDGCNGKVYVKFVGAPEGSNSLPFLFYSHPPPTSTSTNPGIGASGRQITLHGVNFRSDDEIHSFAGDEPEPDKVVSRQYVSATQANITLPMYMLPHKFIELYIVAQYSSGPMKGPTHKLLAEVPKQKANHTNDN